MKNTLQKIGLVGLLIATAGCNPSIEETHRTDVYQGRSRDGENVIILTVDDTYTHESYPNGNSKGFPKGTALTCEVRFPNNSKIIGIDTNYDGIFDNVSFEGGTSRTFKLTPDKVFNAREVLLNSIKDIGNIEHLVNSTDYTVKIQ